MNIAIIGTGNVGLITGACLAQVGNHVICYDIDLKKIDSLKEGNIYIYDSGLDKLVLRLKENFYGRSSLFIYENLEYLDRFFVVDKVAFYKNELEYKEFLQDSNTSTLIFSAAFLNWSVCWTWFFMSLMAAAGILNLAIYLVSFFYLNRHIHYIFVST